MNAEIFEMFAEMEALKFVNARRDTNATIELIGRAEHNDIIAHVAGRINGSSVNESFALRLNGLDALGDAILANGDSSYTLALNVNGEAFEQKMKRLAFDDEAFALTLESEDGATVSAAKKKKKKKKKGGGGGGGIFGKLGRLFKSIYSAVVNMVTSILNYFVGKLVDWLAGSSTMSVSITTNSGSVATADGGCIKPPMPPV